MKLQRAAFFYSNPDNPFWKTNWNSLELFLNIFTTFVKLLCHLRMNLFWKKAQTPFECSLNPSGMNTSSCNSILILAKLDLDYFRTIDIYFAISGCVIALPLRVLQELTSDSCKRPLVAASRPPARGRSWRYPGHSR